jgi:hypothetical protein
MEIIKEKIDNYKYIITMSEAEYSKFLGFLLQVQDQILPATSKYFYAEFSKVSGK